MPADQLLTAASGTYYGEHYIALAVNGTVNIHKSALPRSDSRDSIKFNRIGTMHVAGNGLSTIGFSGEANRILYIQQGAALTTFDLELQKSSEIALPEAPTRNIDWIDPFHFATTLGGNASYSDYDGTNGVSVATNVSDLPVMLSDDNKYMYYFALLGHETALMRAKLTR